MQGRKEDALNVLAYLLSFEEGQNEFFLGVARTLIPVEESMEVIVDKIRLKDELLLLTYYRDDKTYRSIVETVSLIGLLNREKKVAIREILFAYEVIFKEKPSPKKIVSLLILNALITNEDIKETLIDFNLEFEDKNKTIEFQRTKVSKILNLYSPDFIPSIIEDFYINKDLIETEIGKLNGIKLIYLNENKCNVLEGKKEILDFLMKIRNFKVKRAFYTESLNPHSIIKLEEGVEINFPLLGKIKVKTKTLDKDILIINAQGKNRDYSFKFKRIRTSSIKQ